MSIEFHGDSIMRTVENRLWADLNFYAQKVVHEAEMLAPKRTGRLASSIHFTADRANMAVEFFVDAPYGMFVEYGTRYMRPHPYLRPALHSIGDPYGFNFGATFNTPMIVAPLIAHQGGFKLPSSLTAKQLHHIRTHLVPISKRYFVPNSKGRHAGVVSRTRIRHRRDI